MTTPTKLKPNRAPVVYGSNSDVALHFLYIYNKTDVYGDPTLDRLFEVNAPKYKKKDNLDKALYRLVQAGLATFYNDSGVRRYKITQLGVDAIYKIAMYRAKRKSSSRKDDDDD